MLHTESNKHTNFQYNSLFLTTVCELKDFRLQNQNLSNIFIQKRQQQEYYEILQNLVCAEEKNILDL